MRGVRQRATVLPCRFKLFENGCGVALGADYQLGLQVAAVALAFPDHLQRRGVCERDFRCCVGVKSIVNRALRIL